ncbi:MAG: serine hydrolase [Armatimonadota bacterium]
MERPAIEPGWLVSILEQERELLGVPGLVAGYVRGADLPKVAAVGVRRMGSPDAFTSTDVVHIGSCTKAFTALLIADAVSERLLRLSATLGSLSDIWKRSMRRT